MKKAFIIWLALAVASGCSKADGPAPDTGGTEVGFSLAGVSAEVSSSGAVSSVSRAGASGLSSGGATRAMSENLAPGSTVRVLAYTRRGGGCRHRTGYLCGRSHLSGERRLFARTLRGGWDDRRRDGHGRSFSDAAADGDI